MANVRPRSSTNPPGSLVASKHTQCTEIIRLAKTRRASVGTNSPLQWGIKTFPRRKSSADSSTSKEYPVMVLDVVNEGNENPAILEQPSLIAAAYASNLNTNQNIETTKLPNAPKLQQSQLLCCNAVDRSSNETLTDESGETQQHLTQDISFTKHAVSPKEIESLSAKLINVKRQLEESRASVPVELSICFDNSKELIRTVRERLETIIQQKDEVLSGIAIENHNTANNGVAGNIERVGTPPRPADPSPTYRLTHSAVSKASKIDVGVGDVLESSHAPKITKSTLLKPTVSSLNKVREALQPKSALPSGSNCKKVGVTHGNRMKNDSTIIQSGIPKFTSILSSSRGKSMRLTKNLKVGWTDLAPGDPAVFTPQEKLPQGEILGPNLSVCDLGYLQNQERIQRVSKLKKSRIPRPIKGRAVRGNSWEFNSRPLGKFVSDSDTCIQQHGSNHEEKLSRSHFDSIAANVFTAVIPYLKCDEKALALVQSALTTSIYKEFAYFMLFETAPCLNPSFGASRPNNAFPVPACKEANLADAAKLKAQLSSAKHQVTKIRFRICTSSGHKRQLNQQIK